MCKHWNVRALFKKPSNLCFTAFSMPAQESECLFSRDLLRNTFVINTKQCNLTILFQKKEPNIMLQFFKIISSLCKFIKLTELMSSSDACYIQDCGRGMYKWLTPTVNFLSRRIIRSINCNLYCHKSIRLSFSFI